MSERVEWTAGEEAVIAQLYEQRRIEDWEEIARVAHEEYHFPRKNSGLYKERYLTQINPGVFKIEWSYQEQMTFMKLHTEIGNKWATIAQHLKGKTDNCVKNHFYSKLRKLLRKLNKIIQFFLKKQFRPIDISVLYKIVEAAEERFKEKPNCEEAVSRECLGVENKMLEFAMLGDENEEEDEVRGAAGRLEEYKQLIGQIYRVSKLYKRKSKKVRNSLIQAPVNHSRKKNNNKKQQIKDKDDEDDSSSPRQHNKTHQPKQKVSTTILVRKNSQYKKEEEQNRQNNNSHKKNVSQANGKIQVQEGQGIQQMLRTAGILHDEVKHNDAAKNDRNSRKYSNSQYSVSSIQGSNPKQQQQQQQSFLGTSNFEYSPLQSFTSQQMESFLGFPMANSGNNYANFTLSQKSSFKSYSERDPSQIDNPFFDEYSSSNGKLMFPMNFSMPLGHEYQQTYHTENDIQEVGYAGFQYGSVFYQPQGEENGQKTKGNETRK